MSTIRWTQRTIDGKNYYTFEYVLTSRNFARTAFATIAVGNGMTSIASQNFAECGVNKLFLFTLMWLYTVI